MEGRSDDRGTALRSTETLDGGTARRRRARRASPARVQCSSVSSRDVAWRGAQMFGYAWGSTSWSPAVHPGQKFVHGGSPHFGARAR